MRCPQVLSSVAVWTTLSLQVGVGTLLVAYPDMVASFVLADSNGTCVDGASETSLRLVGGQLLSNSVVAAAAAVDVCHATVAFMVAAATWAGVAVVAIAERSSFSANGHTLIFATAGAVVLLNALASMALNSPFVGATDDRQRHSRPLAEPAVGGHPLARGINDDDEDGDDYSQGCSGDDEDVKLLGTDDREVIPERNPKRSCEAAAEANTATKKEASEKGFGTAKLLKLARPHRFYPFVPTTLFKPPGIALAQQILYGSLRMKRFFWCCGISPEQTGDPL